MWSNTFLWNTLNLGLKLHQKQHSHIGVKDLCSEQAEIRANDFLRHVKLE